MNIKAIIWDFEGVLAIPIGKHPHQLIAEQLGVPAEPVIQFFHGEFNDQLDLGLIDIQQFYEELAKALGIAKADAKFDGKYFEKIFENALQINQEIVLFAKSLHQHLRSALMSNYCKHLRDDLFHKWAIGDLFDEIFISAEIQLIKPDPRVFQLALDALCVQANETIFVDDRIVNHQGAQTFGIHSVLFKNNQQAMQEINTLLGS